MLVSLFRRVSASVSLAPAEEAVRKARRSFFEKLTLGGAALAALVTGAAAQTAGASYNMDGTTAETRETTASGTTLNMDSGLPAVVMGGTTAASNKTIENNGTLTATANVIQVEQGSGNTINNNGTGTMSSTVSAIYAASGTTGTTVANAGILTSSGGSATVNIQGTTNGVSSTNSISNTGTGAAIYVGGVEATNTGISLSGTVSGSDSLVVGTTGFLGATTLSVDGTITGGITINTSLGTNGTVALNVDGGTLTDSTGRGIDVTGGIATGSSIQCR